MERLPVKVAAVKVPPVKRTAKQEMKRAMECPADQQAKEGLVRKTGKKINVNTLLPLNGGYGF